MREAGLEHQEQDFDIKSAEAAGVYPLLPETEPDPQFLETVASELKKATLPQSDSSGLRLAVERVLGWLNRQGLEIKGSWWNISALTLNGMAAYYASVIQVYPSAGTRGLLLILLGIIGAVVCGLVGHIKLTREVKDRDVRDNERVDSHNKECQALSTSHNEKVRLLEGQVRDRESELALERQKVDGWQARVTQMRSALISMLPIQLQELHDVLGLQDHGRITLFRRSAKGLSLVGRYARNPEWCLADSLDELERFNVGCVGKALSKGEDFSSYDRNPITDLDEYIAEQHSKHGLSPDEARNLKMKSRIYYGLAIMDASGRNRVGVVVVESVRRKGFLKKDAARACKDRQGMLSEWISLLNQEVRGPFENE